jgi:hypothetical protein
VGDGSGDYFTEAECRNNCQQQIYLCKEGEFGACIEQLGPCISPKVECGPAPN